jgi:hypothetical protein
MVDQLSHFKLFLACCSCQYFSAFRNPFFIFHLDNPACRLIGETTDADRVTDLFLPFLYIPYVLVYAHASVGVFTRTRDALSPIPPGGFNFSVDG